MKELQTIGKLTSIAPPEQGTQEHRDFYSLYYKLKESDSHRESRTSLLKKLESYCATNPFRLTEKSVILDIGAGKQILETELEEGRRNGKLGSLPTFNVITLDIADIPWNQLLAPKHFPDSRRHLHVIADAANLPIPDEAIDGGISNMALDFSPKEAIGELFRVLKKGAPAFVNLHHPSQLADTIEDELKIEEERIAKIIRHGGKPSRGKELGFASLRYKKFLKDNKILFENEEDIRKAFEDQGFSVWQIKLNSKDNYKWWEVDVVKPAKIKL